MSTEQNELIQDLSNVPNIISSLGLGIAAAQKAFNLEYLNGLERLMALAKMLNVKDKNDFRDMFMSMVTVMAPPRYQFAETVLTVRMDISQSLQKGSAFQVGGSVGAVTLNAAMTAGFSSSYRAATEIKTVIQVSPFDPTLVAALFSRAADLNDKVLDLPPLSDVDKAYMEKSAKIFEKVTVETTSAPPVETPEPPVGTPEPPVGTPEPPVGTPEPLVGTPEPPEG